MAQLVGDAYVRVFADTDALRRAIKRDAKRIGAEGGDDLAESLLTNFGKTIEQQADARLRRYQLSLADAIAGEDFDRMLKASGMKIEDFVANIEKDLRNFESKGYFKKVAGNAYDFEQSLNALDRWAERTKVADEIQRVTIAVEKQNRAYATYAKNIEVGTKRIEEESRTFRRWGNDVDHVTILLNRHAEVQGRIFGKGSRNNFLNFIGSVMEGLSAIPSAVVGGLGKLVSFTADAVDQFHDLSKTMSAGRAVFTLAGRAMAGLAAGIASILIGVAAMGQIMPAVIVLVANLAGALVAVAGAIGVGLIGGLLALGPVLAATALGIVGLVSGISGISDATDKMKKKLDPLVKAWERMRKVLTDDFINKIAPAMDDLARVVNFTLLPAMRTMNKVIGYLAQRFADVFNSPMMQPFLDAWETTVPRIFANVGKGLIDLLAGIIAFFTPILPYAERLAEAFSEMMTTFRNWAASAAGQNAVADFMEKAWGMAKQLWAILGNVGSILGSIFMAGAEGPGKDFLQWLADVTEKWAAWLKTDEGQAAMKQFFEDVKTTMGQVREIISTIKDRMDNIDWAQAEEDVKAFLNAVETAFSVLGYVFSQTSAAVNTVRDTIGQLGEGGFSGIFSDMKTEAEEFGTAMNEHFTAWAENARGWAESFGATINSGLDSALAAVLGWMTSVGETINGLLDAAWQGISSRVSTWPGAIAAFIALIPSWVGAALAGLATYLLAPFLIAWNNLQNFVTQWGPRIGAFVGMIPGAITRALAGLLAVLTLPFVMAWNNVMNTVRGWPGAIQSFVAGIPAAVTRGLAGLVGAFTAPFAQAYGAIQGWIASIREAVNGIISWVGNHMPSIDLNPFSLGRGGGGPSFGPNGTVSGARGAGLRGASGGSGAMSLTGTTLSALAALQQPMPQTGAQKVLNFQPGSIVIQTKSERTDLVAMEVVDRLVAAI